jgi:hypothetical protein
MNIHLRCSSNIVLKPPHKYYTRLMMIVTNALAYLPKTAIKIKLKFRGLQFKNFYGCN